MTNINVHSKTSGDSITHEGDGWDIDDYQTLNIRNGDEVVATYARGEWASVTRAS